jgi:hypothetical protein
MNGQITFGGISADDRETPFTALQDIDVFLESIAFICNKKRSNLGIYDPYYCHGSIKTDMEKLGYCGTFIHNDPVDCYLAQKLKKVPDHDVVLTNPPFSGDHIKRALVYVQKSKKPWAFLLPSNVFLRPWFEELFACDSIYFIAPHTRYSFEAPSTQTTTESHTPFVTMWYIGGIDFNPHLTSVLQEMWRASSRNSQATLATSAEELPRRIRKLLPFTKVRCIPSQNVVDTICSLCTQFVSSIV